MLERIDRLVELADQYKEKLPESAQAPYYELIYYPAVAVANVNRMQIYSGLNQAYAKQNEWRPKGAYPVPVYVDIPDEAHMYVRLQGDSKAYDSGSADLQDFTSINDESY